MITWGSCDACPISPGKKYADCELDDSAGYYPEATASGSASRASARPVGSSAFNSCHRQADIAKRIDTPRKQPSSVA